MANENRLNYRIWNKSINKMEYIPNISVNCSEITENEILMQSTPFCDINQILIYERDFLISGDKKIIREVVFKNGCWMAEKKKGQSNVKKDMFLFELINLDYSISGNIFESIIP